MNIWAEENEKMFVVKTTTLHGPFTWEQAYKWREGIDSLFVREGSEIVRLSNPISADGEGAK